MFYVVGDPNKHVSLSDTAHDSIDQTDHHAPSQLAAMMSDTQVNPDTSCANPTIVDKSPTNMSQQQSPQASSSLLPCVLIESMSIVNSDVTLETRPSLHTTPTGDTVISTMVSDATVISESSSVTDFTSRFPPETIITEEDEEQISQTDYGNLITISENNNNPVIDELKADAKVNGKSSEKPDTFRVTPVQVTAPRTVEFEDADMEEQSNDPLSESTREKLKLPLEQLDDMCDTSPELTAVSSYNYPHTSYQSLLCKWLLGTMLLFLAIILFLESEMAHEIDYVHSFKVLYYRPLKTRLFQTISKSGQLSYANT